MRAFAQLLSKDMGLDFWLIGLLCCWGVLTLLPGNSYAARVVAEKRECATCHIAWMSDFKGEDVFTLIPNDPRPMQKTGRQDVVSTERMCFSCHDGFVLDSRFLWKGAHSHPVGVKPSDQIVLPTEDGKNIFPLNDAGNIYCGTCHSAHGVEWGDALSPVFLRARNIDSSFCIMCHVDRKGEIDDLQNHPLMKDVADNIQGLKNVGSKFGNENKVICQSCHKVHGAEEKKLLVTKNEQSQLCSKCHANKVSGETKIGRQHFTHPVNRIPKNALVPRKLFEQGSKLGPNKEVVCETCHKVHHAPSKKLIRFDIKSFKNGICVTCHNSKRGILTNGHNMFKTRNGDVMDSPISPMLGPCGACHNVHDGKGLRMWARDIITGDGRMAGLCLSCHQKGHLAEKFTVGKYSHPVGVTLPEGIDNSKGLPLFTPQGVFTTAKKYGQVSCPTCHDIHKSRPSDNAALVDDNPGLHNKYLRIGARDHRILCKSCHLDKWSIVDTKHNIGKTFTGKNSTDNALGVCGTCHLVHNGKGPRMWARDSILSQQGPSVLCLSCHSKGALAKSKTIGTHSHPIGVSLENAGIHVTTKGWRVGDGVKGNVLPPALPLYDEHGNRSEAGDMVECPTCHDPHRWSPPLTLSRKDKNSVDEEGDARNSFLRVTAAPDGKLCTICHRSKTTIRQTDHDMRVSAPESTNALQANSLQSGVCGQCHAVHNARQDLVLWARAIGPGRNVPERLCRSCHSEGRVAQKKDPTHANHPGYVRAWSSDLRRLSDRNSSDIPMFSVDGRRSNIGYISCPTCHNAHQWSARSTDEGSGNNEEGDVLSSFLRLPSTEGFVCADCHGLDSIFRYKYFHGTVREMFPGSSRNGYSNEEKARW